MGSTKRYRRWRAALGFLKTLVMLLAAPFLLLAWMIQASIARQRFLQELRSAGVPEQAARMLSSRYKLRLRDLAGMAVQAGHQFNLKEEA